MDEMPDVGNQKPCAREFAIMGLKGKYIYIFIYIYPMPMESISN